MEEIKLFANFTYLVILPILITCSTKERNFLLYMQGVIIIF